MTESPIAPMTTGERLGCLSIIAAIVLAWLGLFWGVFEIGRHYPRKSEAQEVAELKALPVDVPSVEIQP